MPVIAMLSNPLSQRNRRGMADDRGGPRRPAATSATSVFEPGMDLAALMAELAGAEVGLIVLNSGDGLVHGVLGALFLGGAFAEPPPWRSCRAA